MKKIKWIILLGAACFWANGVASAASPALLKAGDVLEITVQGEPELSGNRVVGHDGSISLPLVGSIGVAGMKTTDAALIIKQHLEDGFLKNPKVNVSTSKSFSSNTTKSSPKVSKMSESDMTYAVVDDNPLGVVEDEEVPVAPVTDEQILVEIKDASTNKGIADAVLTVDNKVYQTNRLGQILVSNANGRAIVIADGYKTVAGSFGSMIISGKAGTPSCIVLEKTLLVDTVIGTVVDANSHKPVKNAEVYLDGSKINTNSRGEFKISGIKKEFSEVIIKKRGYNDLKSVIDYKGSSEITFELKK